MLIAHAKRLVSKTHTAIAIKLLVILLLLDALAEQLPLQLVASALLNQNSQVASDHED
jgi:hypothetical protein